MVEAFAAGDGLDAAQFGDVGEEGGPGVDEKSAGGRIAAAEGAKSAAALQGAATLGIAGEEGMVGSEFGVVGHEEEVDATAGGAAGELCQALALFGGAGVEERGKFSRGVGVEVVFEQGHDRDGVDADAGEFEEVVVTLAAVDPGLGGGKAAPQVGAEV